MSSVRQTILVQSPLAESGHLRGELRGTDSIRPLLGQWYATAVFWKPQVALFVNEPTPLPVLMPLAPATTLLVGFPQQVATVLATHGASDTIIGDTESGLAAVARLSTTAQPPQPDVPLPQNPGGT